MQTNKKEKENINHVLPRRVKSIEGFNFIGENAIFEKNIISLVKQIRENEKKEKKIKKIKNENIIKHLLKANIQK